MSLADWFAFVIVPTFVIGGAALYAYLAVKSHERWRARHHPGE